MPRPTVHWIIEYRLCIYSCRQAIDRCLQRINVLNGIAFFCWSEPRIRLNRYAINDLFTMSEQFVRKLCKKCKMTRNRTTTRFLSGFSLLGRCVRFWIKLYTEPNNTLAMESKLRRYRDGRDIRRLNRSLECLPRPPNECVGAEASSRERRPLLQFYNTLLHSILVMRLE